MGKISVFNFVSVDGFFSGPNGEIDWFYEIEKDDEWEKLAHSQSASGEALIFGYVTYFMMKSFWPAEEGIKSDPEMAEVINNKPKLVFSKKLKNDEEGPNWKNITVLNKINPDEIKKLKEQHNYTILGSGSIIQQLANLDLIDEYELAVVPVVLGSGKSFFTDVKKTNLELTEAKSFGNGIVLLNLKVLRKGNEKDSFLRTSEAQPGEK